MPTKRYTINETDLVDYKRKHLARKTLTQMLKKGEIVRGTCCELCKANDKTEGHHLDYGKPREVMWLCKPCHGIVHHHDHALNPRNIPQTTTAEVWAHDDYVTVSVKVPVENFILIKKMAERRHSNVSKLVRGCVLKEYAVDEKHIDFTIFERQKHESDSRTSQRVSVLEHDQKRLHEQKSQKIWPLWVQGFDLGERMGRFSDVLYRYGANASQMRWVSAAR